jgi:hypothetical protein
VDDGGRVVLVEAWVPAEHLDGAYWRPLFPQRLLLGVVLRVHGVFVLDGCDVAEAAVQTSPRRIRGGPLSSPHSNFVDHQVEDSGEFWSLRTQPWLLQ